MGPTMHAILQGCRGDADRGLSKVPRCCPSLATWYRLIAPGSIPRSLLRTFNFEIWKLKCLGACPEDLYSGFPIGSLEGENGLDTEVSVLSPATCRRRHVEAELQGAAWDGARGEGRLPAPGKVVYLGLAGQPFGVAKAVDDMKRRFVEGTATGDAVLTVINKIEECDTIGALLVGEVRAGEKLLIHDAPVGGGITSLPDGGSAGEAMVKLKIHSRILNLLPDRPDARVLNGKIVA